MKQVGLFILLFFVYQSNYAQVQTGAISITNLCGNNGIDGGGCDESSMYTVFAPMTLAGTTTYGTNCGGTNVSPGGAGGTAATSHFQAYISVLIPASCTVTIETEYGAPYNANSSCVDSRMDAASSRTDALCINDGGTGVNATALSIVASQPVAVGEYNSAITATAANIGTCSAGAAGVTGTINGGATGLNSAPAGSVCWMTGGSGNANVICTKTGFTGGASARWANLWYMANRGDEIMTYTITPTAGTCTNTTYIVLPVEILGIAAYNTDDNNILLAWATATETNNNYFMIEYSLDGKIFIPYKEVKGAGNSLVRKDYTCLFLEKIGNERPYFRLKQVDNNGNFKYSQVIMLGTSYGALKNKNATLMAYYNVDDDKIISKFKLTAPSQVNLVLYNLSGELISTYSNLFAEGENEIALNAPDKAGIYLLVYQTEDGLTFRKKIIVTK